MTLAELCEPLFQYVCRLNRSAAKGATHVSEQVRQEIQMQLEECKTRSRSDPALAMQFEKVELPLIFFCDFMVRNSMLEFASEWKDLAAERKELAGDEKFFDLLDQTLAERNDQAAERLVIFYNCLGLGFTGWYTGQPEFLRKKMLEIAARIRAQVDGDAAAKICPDAYEHVNTSNFTEPPGSRVAGIAIALVGLIIVLFAVNAYLYRASSSDLVQSLQQVIDHPKEP